MNTSEKPEVARRAATTVLNIAGIATDTKPEKPTTPTPQSETENDKSNDQLEPTPEDQTLIASLSFLLQLKDRGLDLQNLPQEKLPDLITFLTNFNHPANPAHQPLDDFNDLEPVSKTTENTENTETTE
jgi:hypothetical protein